MFESENLKETPLPESAPAQEAMQAPKYPEPKAAGNEMVSILNHGLVKKAAGPGARERIGVELKLQNNSDKIVGTASFEAVFYDADGNIVDTVKQHVSEMTPGPKALPVYVASSVEADKVASYSVSVVKTTAPPTPSVIGNDKVLIVNHTLLEMQLQVDLYQVGVDFSMKNASDVTIATLIFDAELFDKDGDVIERVTQKEIEFRPGQSRGVRLCASTKDYNVIKSYAVRITKMVTVDFEKVQIRKRDIKINKAGELDISGSVKNIFEARTDAALVASFYDTANQDIGSKVVMITGIEPGSHRQFHFDFKPAPGDVVNTCILKIVSDISTA